MSAKYEDEIVAERDVGGRDGGGIDDGGGDAVSLLEGLLGGGFIGEGIQGVRSGQSGGEVINSNIGESGGFESGLFSAGESGGAGGVEDEDSGCLIGDAAGGCWGGLVGEDTVDVGLDFRVIGDSGGGIDVRDFADDTVGQERFGLEEGYFGDIAPVNGGGEMCQSFELSDGEISAKIVVEGVGEVEQVGDR